MNSKLIIRSVIVTLVLLPTSCMAGHMASGELARRTDNHVPPTNPLWYENVLWLVALALMIVWAWAMKRIWEKGE